ncbi:MAG TPA: SAM-dependent DNA methyltransferase, partial [Actinobacteria bacterium]|nr:SAM-dependent DNA methyltransferase [Actinomycetota bacterium]
EKICNFINFEDDGYIVAKHIGLVETVSAKDKKQHLLDVWFDRIEPETKFCVKTTIEEDDEWLHSFYYFNDEIPTDQDFQKTIADYITFEANMITHGRGYLFGFDSKETLADGSQDKVNSAKQDAYLKVAEESEEYHE